MEEATFQGYIAVLIDAAVRIPASTREYVRRFVTITAPGLTASILRNTLVSVVIRLHIQETAETSLTTGPHNQENTIFLIQPISRFLFTVTCSQKLALYGHWYSRYPLPIGPHIRIRGLARIFLWMTTTMNRTGTLTAFPYHICSLSQITPHIWE